jgi:thimet oligopeptidase
MTELAPLVLPDSDSDWTDFVSERSSKHLERATSLIAELKDGTARDAVSTLRVWNDVTIAVSNADSILGLLAQVHPSEDVRSLAEQREQQVQQLVTDLGLDRGLYDVLIAIDSTGLDAGATRVLEHSLRDFRRSGVDRDEATRDRLRTIRERQTLLGQEFGRNTRDDVRSIRIAADRLGGLPRDYIEAHPADADGLVTITTDYPDIIPFRTFADDGQARFDLTVEFLNRAWPANESVLTELLALRAERAALLGYDSWAAYDAEVKMVGSSAAIADFIERISGAAEESAHRDYDTLLARSRVDDPSVTSVDLSSMPYFAEVIRRENFDVDAQIVRRYFDFTRVRSGLLEVTGRLFGLQYREIPNAPVWHADVTAYDVLVDDAVIGRIYLDLHPRAGKYKHAAQFGLVSGIRDRQLPEGVLVCNFARGLMEHPDVVTMFHEFGHLIHEILAGHHEWAQFSGVATEWDFVEAPSQMLEEWAWDADVLGSFAVDADGTSIPAELVAKMRAGNEFGKGYQTRTQMFYAALSYQVHLGAVDDITDLVRTLQKRYSLFDFIEGTHMQDSFGHLDGYTSAYYTYEWSLVIAKDMFAAFDRSDLFDTVTSFHYRDRVLAPGGSKDAADLVADFLGRPYNFDAFIRWLSAG